MANSFHLNIKPKISHHKCQNHLSNELLTCKVEIVGLPYFLYCMYIHYRLIWRWRLFLLDFCLSQIGIEAFIVLGIYVPLTPSLFPVVIGRSFVSLRAVKLKIISSAPYLCSFALILKEFFPSSATYGLLSFRSSKKVLGSFFFS